MYSKILKLYFYFYIAKGKGAYENHVVLPATPAYNNASTLACLPKVCMAPSVYM